MAIQSRFNAVQNESVRLYHTFQNNGVLIDLPSPPTVTILSPGGTTALATITATKESVGRYYVDWFVPISADLGTYYDQWLYVFTDTSATQILRFQVHSKDSIVNFSADNVAIKLSDRMTELLRHLSNDFIYEAQHIPVYWEQGLRTPDLSRFSFAFPNWLDEPRPLVRVNDMLRDAGWYYDKSGNLFFQDELDELDTVMAQYYFSYFGLPELVDFIQQGLDAVNALPPSGFSYAAIDSTPFYWDHPIVLYAAIVALRRLLFGLSFQERATIFGEDPERQNAARSQFQALYSDYSALWLELAKGLKKELPGSAVVVVPEYTLPGGRARWFRYMFTTSAGG